MTVLKEVKVCGLKRLTDSSKKHSEQATPPHKRNTAKSILTNTLLGFKKISAQEVERSLPIKGTKIKLFLM